MSFKLMNRGFLILVICAGGFTMGCGDDGSDSEVYVFEDPNGETDGQNGAQGNMPGDQDPGGMLPTGGDNMGGGETPEPMDPAPMDPEPNDPEPMDPEPMDPEPTDPGNGMMSGGGNNGNGDANTPRVLGAACTGNADCDSGLCVDGMPNGYCTSVCQSSDDCGPGGSCWNLGQPDMLCLKDCTENSECREGDGYICDSDNTCFPNGGGSGGGGAPPGENPAVCERPDIACVGETVADFSLINCGTGQPVSMRAHFGNQRAGMFVLTAGWCPACAQWLPQIVMLESNPQAAGLKVAYILGENANHAQPDQRYCQQYANRHGVDINNMFMDHDGSDSFRTIFANMWPYVGADGSFGLPFNAVVNPANWEYIYADRGPGGDLNQALSSLLQ